VKFCLHYCKTKFNAELIDENNDVYSTTLDQYLSTSPSHSGPAAVRLSPVHVPYLIVQKLLLIFATSFLLILHFLFNCIFS